MSDNNPSSKVNNQSSGANKQSSEHRLLPAPSEASSTQLLDVGSDTAIKLDALGPMVVNSDGTLSRIENWVNMTELERERTLRVLGARNKIRIDYHRGKEENSSEGVTAPTE